MPTTENTPLEMVPQTEVKPTESTHEPKVYDEKYVTRLRDEAANERKRVAAVEAEKAELVKYREERENADLLKEKKYEELAAKAEEKNAKLQAEHAKDLAARDHRVMITELRAKAREAGIFDIDDVKAMDTADLSIDEDGEIVGVDELIASYKARKPHWFKGDESKSEDDDEKPKKPKAPASVSPSKRETPSQDAFALDKEEYANLRSRLLQP